MLKPPLLGNTGEIIPDPGVIGQNKVSGLKGPKTVSRAKTQRRKESVTAGELIAHSKERRALSKELAHSKVHFFILDELSGIPSAGLDVFKS